jgi:RNA polymerase primary sigma factor
MEASQRFQDDRPADAEPYLVEAEAQVDGDSPEITASPAEVITPLDLDSEEAPPARLTNPYRLDSLPEDEVESEMDGSVIDPVRQLLKKSRRYPLLNAGQEVDLSKRIERGDLDAKELLINSNLRLVASYARHYEGHGMTLDDLVQEGMLGLIRASEKFDHRKGFRFSTYATLWIRQSITRGMGNTGTTIRLPIHVAQRMREIQRAERELTQRLGVEPTAEELAEATGIDIEKIIEAHELAVPMASLNQTVEDGETELVDFVADEADTYQEAQDRGRHLRVLQHIHDAVAERAIDSREAALIVRRFGFGESPKPETQRAIAHDLGIKVSQVAQIEEVVLNKLRPWFAEERLT